MSGTGVTNFSFTEGSTLPDNVTTATSGGDNINVFKANYIHTAGGKYHRKSYNKKKKSIRKIKTNKKSKKNKSRKNTRRNKRK